MQASQQQLAFLEGKGRIKQSLQRDISSLALSLLPLQTLLKRETMLPFLPPDSLATLSPSLFCCCGDFFGWILISPACPFILCLCASNTCVSFILPQSSSVQWRTASHQSTQKLNTANLIPGSFSRLLEEYTEGAPWQSPLSMWGPVR